MKKVKYIVCFFIILFAFCYFFSKNYSYAYGPTSDEIIRSIQEIADAYYNKGDNIQYCDYRSSFFLPPEEATSQNTLYQVCNVHVFSIYYQAFGIVLPGSTHEMMAYAHQYYDTNNIVTNDVIEYWERHTDDLGNTVYYDNVGNEKEIDLSTEEERQKYVVKLLKDYGLQVGDILVSHSGINGNNSGHALIIYNITYNSNGEPTNAIIREAIPSFNKKITKISTGLSNASILNEQHNIYEGSLLERKLRYNYYVTSTSTRDSVVYRIKDANYFAIIRPLLKDESGNYTGKYYSATFERSSSTLPTGYIVKSRTLKDYGITNATLNRINYSRIDIEKTVNVFNKSVVGWGDILEYSIRVKNGSSETYNDFNIDENISEYVELIDLGGGSANSNKISWTIHNLEAGEEITIKYKVKVKFDESVLGKKIVSTGTVAGIPSATIENVVSNKFADNNQSLIKALTQSVINNTNYKGKRLIAEIYNGISIYDLNLDTFEMENLIVSNNDVTYYPTSDLGQTAVYLNENNSYSTMVLGDYFGALYTNNNNYAAFKRWENYKYLSYKSRDIRMDTILKENFKTGDILVYKNEQTSNEQVTYETETGMYYLIYISDADKINVDGTEMSGFIGRDETGIIKNIKTDYMSMQTLLGKDYYVILRPSLSIEVGLSIISVTTLPTKIEYVQGKANETLDLTGGILTVGYNDGTEEEIDLTSEGITVSGFSNTTTGPKTITVSYEGFETTFEVEVVPPQMESISVTTLPVTEYELGAQELDLTGGVLTITYNNNTTTTIPLTSERIEVSGFDSSSAGTKTITVEYLNFTTTFEVTVNKAVLGIPEVSIDIDGIVTWTNVEGATSYEVSFDNVTYEAETSGNVTIPLTEAGLVTAYVKAIPDNNHITTSNAYGNASVNVYSLMLTGDPGIDNATGSGNYVSGKEVTISATLKSGYDFNGWTVTSGDTPTNVNSLTTTVTLTQNTTLQATTELTPKEAGHVTLDSTEGSITYGESSKTFNITSSHGGELSVTDDNDTAITLIDGDTVIVSNLDTINVGTTITVIVTSAETSEYTEASATYTLTIDKAMLDMPEVEIDTNGIVTWDDVEGAASYEVSFDNVTYVAGTSGNVIIPLTETGLITVYVKALPDGNHITSSNSYGSEITNVYSLAITGDEGIDTVTGSGYYVDGKEVTISTTLKSGYDFNEWTVTAGNTPTDVNSLTTTVVLTQNTTLNAISVEPFVEPVFNLPNMTVDTNSNVFNKIESQTDISELFNTTNNNDSVEIYSRWGILLYSKDITNSVYLSTGQYVTYLNENGERVRYDIVVPGDTDGNGIISYMDYVKVYNHIKKAKHPELTNKSLLEGDYLLAGDMYSDNKINYLDYVRIYNKIKDLKNL